MLFTLCLLNSLCFDYDFLFWIVLLGCKNVISWVFDLNLETRYACISCFSCIWFADIWVGVLVVCFFCLMLIGLFGVYCDLYCLLYACFVSLMLNWFCVNCTFGLLCCWFAVHVSFVFCLFVWVELFALIKVCILFILCFRFRFVFLIFVFLLILFGVCLLVGGFDLNELFWC